MIRAKVVTTMRKKPQEYEAKRDGDRPQAIPEKCDIFGVYLEELTLDGAWGSALEASVAAEIFKVAVRHFPEGPRETCQKKLQRRRACSR